jgi:hypothetical protein
MNMDDVNTDDLRIDKDDLDNELVYQAQLYYNVAREYVLAVSQRDQQKESVAIERSLAYERARQELESSGGKVTEAAIASRIELDRSVRSATEKYDKARFSADLRLAAKEAWQQRAFMLRDLASLYVAEYYSQSSVRGGDAREVQEQGYRRQRARLSEERNRRRV